MTILTRDNFEAEVLASEKPAVVDFWASWCGPCMMLAPLLEEIAAEKAGSLTVGKVNVDEQPALARRFGVSSIPTLVLMKDGRPVSQSVGYMPKQELLRFAEQ